MSWVTFGSILLVGLVLGITFLPAPDNDEGDST